MKTTRIPFIALALAVAVSACDEAPTTPTPTGIDAAAAEIAPPHASTSGLTHSAAPFRNWHQGFDHGTEGWYGKDQAGELGWCGTVDAEHRARGPGSMAPSAGRGYAVVAQDVCNDLWDTEFSGPPLGTLVGAPWAPGPGFAAIGSTWPASGYAVELDIYLDPDDAAYSPSPPSAGQWVFTDFFSLSGAPDLADFYRNAVFNYGVSFEDPAGSFAFNYVTISVLEDDGGLSVGTPAASSLATVTEPGWYTFRFVFSEDDGALAVTFELADRRGGTLLSEPMTSLFFAPASSPSDFEAASIGTGYAWFPSMAEGLALPIDEYRLRRGR